MVFFSPKSQLTKTKTKPMTKLNINLFVLSSYTISTLYKKPVLKSTTKLKKKIIRFAKHESLFLLRPQRKNAFRTQFSFFSNQNQTDDRNVGNVYINNIRIRGSAYS